MEGVNAIAIKTSILFEVMAELDIDATTNPEDQQRVLREVQKIDTEDTGFFTFSQMLELVRSLDNYWDIVERRTQIAIIEETSYSDRDIENLRQVFNEYGANTGNKVYMSVSNFR